MLSLFAVVFCYFLFVFVCLHLPEAEEEEPQMKETAEEGDSTSSPVLAAAVAAPAAAAEAAAAATDCSEEGEELGVDKVILMAARWLIASGEVQPQEAYEGVITALQQHGAYGLHASMHACMHAAQPLHACSSPSRRLVGYRR